MGIEFEFPWKVLFITCVQTENKILLCYTWLELGSGKYTFDVNDCFLC